MPECPVCYGSNNVPFIQVGNKYQYHLCVCGAAFLYPRMSDQELLDWYASGAYRKRTSSWDENNVKGINQHKVRAEYITSLLGKFNLDSHLDIGCSSGELLRAVKVKYPDIFQMGVDPDPTLSTDEFAIFPDISEIDRDFDFITIIQTLEHLNDPNKMIDAIWNRLQTGGLLMLEVPNRRCDIVAYIAPQHVVAYDEKSLRGLLANFDIKYILLHGKSYNSPLDRSILVVATK